MNNNNQLEKYNPGFFQNVGLELRLVLRLLGDSRVPIFAKLLPVGALVYGIAPDFFPVVDDAILFGVVYYAFTALCPPNVVEEHRQRLLKEGGFITETVSSEQPDPEVVQNAEYREVSAEDEQHE